MYVKDGTKWLPVLRSPIDNVVLVIEAGATYYELTVNSSKEIKAKLPVKVSKKVRAEIEKTLVEFGITQESDGSSDE